MPTDTFDSPSGSAVQWEAPPLAQTVTVELVGPGGGSGANGSTGGDPSGDGGAGGNIEVEFDVSGGEVLDLYVGGAGGGGGSSSGGSGGVGYFSGGAGGEGNDSNEHGGGGGGCTAILDESGSVVATAGGGGGSGGTGVDDTGGGGGGARGGVGGVSGGTGDSGEDGGGTGAGGDGSDGESHNPGGDGGTVHGQGTLISSTDGGGASGGSGQGTNNSTGNSGEDGQVIITYDVPVSETFAYDGESPQTWSPPTGVTEVFIEVNGAGGGGNVEESGDNSRGGNGGYVEGLIDVSSISSLDLYVADGGEYGDFNETGTTASGGWGRISGNDADDVIAGGGGGMSAVIDPSQHTANPSDPDTEYLLKAGGGGGSAYGGANNIGGDGADSAVGGDGADYENDGEVEGYPGTGDADSSVTNVTITEGGGSLGGGDTSEDGADGSVTIYYFTTGSAIWDTSGDWNSAQEMSDVYVDGTIFRLLFLLYNLGEGEDAFVAGIESGSGNRAKNSDHLLVEVTGNSGSTADWAWRTSGTIDLTPYSSIEIDWANTGGSNAVSSFHVATEDGTSQQNVNVTGSFTEQTDSLDVSGINSSLVVLIHATDEDSKSEVVSSVEAYRVELIE